MGHPSESNGASRGQGRRGRGRGRGRPNGDGGTSGSQQLKEKVESEPFQPTLLKPLRREVGTAGSEGASAVHALPVPSSVVTGSGGGAHLAQVTGLYTQGHPLRSASIGASAGAGAGAGAGQQHTTLQKGTTQHDHGRNRPNRRGPPGTSQQAPSAVTAANPPAVVVVQRGGNAPSSEGSLNRATNVVDKRFRYQPEVLSKLLTENTDFAVVGVLGHPGVGKSTVISNICGSQKQDNGDLHGAFEVASRDSLLEGKNGTAGVDVCISPERVVCIDTCPLFGLPALYRAFKDDTSDGGEGAFDPVTMVEYRALQVALFLFTVCDTVVVVQESTADLQLCKFLQVLEMLLPTIKPDQKPGPRTVFVNTKVAAENMIESTMARTRRVMNRLLSHSALFGSCHHLFVPQKEDSSQRPDYALMGIHPQGSYDESMNRVRDTVLGLNPHAGTPRDCTEREWGNQCLKTWETIENSEIVKDYIRTMEEALCVDDADGSDDLEDGSNHGG